MLSYIQTKYALGTTITLTCTQGAVSGNIEFVNPQFIVLRKNDNTVVGIAAADIKAFSTNAPELNAAYVDQTDRAFTPLAATVPAAAAALDDESDTTAAPESPAAADEPTPEVPLAKQPLAATQTAAELEGVVRCKVVGSIPIDRLEQIDPKFKRRNYFKKDNGEQTPGDEEGTNEKPAGTTDDESAEGAAYNSSADYVAAMGRITHYNNDKKFGFIHDFAADIDLYFNLQQIVDSQLYDQLYKGTKVAYTIDTNRQGHIARCIHLPHSVRDLIPIADDLIDARRYLPARNLLKQILSVSPHNGDAEELLSEVEGYLTTDGRYIKGSDTAGQQPEFYSTLYSQAKKAYLAKDVDAAIELYLKALEAGEKEESCIKDLVTLYVSLFKQAATAAERDGHRRKAIGFIEKYIDRLPQNLTTQQFLALNFYLPLNDYENLIVAIDTILTNEQIIASPSKRAFFMWQKASALNRLGRTDEALAIIDEALADVPHHMQLNRLKNLILHPRTDYAAYGDASDENGESVLEVPQTAEYEAPEAEEPAAPSGEAADEAVSAAVEMLEGGAPADEADKL